MPAIVLVVREPGQLKVEFSLQFVVPEIPRVGDYISVTRIDVREPLSEDYIVRKIWWRLHHRGDADDEGGVSEIFVECDTACGPYATREWQQRVAQARAREVNVENFEVARVTTGLGNDLSDDRSSSGDSL
jgi:hypothetical protein